MDLPFKILHLRLNVGIGTGTWNIESWIGNDESKWQPARDSQHSYDGFGEYNKVYP